MDFSEQDRHWMQVAIEQARLGEGLTSPNPPVGAVLALEERLIGQGYHREAGKPHAEREAFRDALERGNKDILSKVTLYVTLEPCSSHGRTPPCTDAILQYGIARVVYGSMDPDPRHRGGACHLLKDAGIPTGHGLLEDECDYLIRAFKKNVQEKRPWVVVKTAMSLDGRIVRKPENSQWLTSKASRRRVHSLRAYADAILTGGQTVRVDNPALTIREPDHAVSPHKKQPWRIIATRDASAIPSSSICLNDEWKERTLVCENIDSWKRFLEELYASRHISTLMVEAGGDLVKKLLNESLVDEWVGFYAPMITGGSQLAVGGESFLPREAHLERIKVMQLENDICVNGLLKYES